MIVVKSITMFYDFFHDESVSFVVCNYLCSCNLSDPSNLVIVFFLFVQRIKASVSQ